MARFYYVLNLRHIVLIFTACKGFLVIAMESQYPIAALSILLADDDIDDCDFFKGALDEFPILTHFTAVHDGEQLMQLLTNETEVLPHVIFLDLNMPRKNGFECLAAIKLNGKLNSLPVIMYSTSLDQEVVNRLHTNGAHHFIRKPSDFTNFKKIIRTALTLITEGKVTQPLIEDFVLTA